MNDINITHFAGKVNLIKTFFVRRDGNIFLFSIDKPLEIWYNDKRKNFFERNGEEF